MTTPRILVAGIGNVFMGDDGFGVAVVQSLVARPRRAGVTLMDAGIRGIDLTYALMDGYDAAILVDAAPRGHAPGTLCVLEPTLPAVEREATLLDTHDLDPAKVLAAARALGTVPGVVRVVACEPSRLGTLEEPLFELSPEVASAVAPAARLIDELIDELSAIHGETREKSAHA
jgi:hydrogenase maturation protease